jgi:hypothetical protein
MVVKQKMIFLSRDTQTNPDRLVDTAMGSETTRAFEFDSDLALWLGSISKNSRTLTSPGTT